MFPNIILYGVRVTFEGSELLYSPPLVRKVCLPLGSEPWMYHWSDFIVILQKNSSTSSKLHGVRHLAGFPFEEKENMYCLKHLRFLIRTRETKQKYKNRLTITFCSLSWFPVKFDTVEIKPLLFGNLIKMGFKTGRNIWQILRSFNKFKILYFGLAPDFRKILRFMLI